MNLRIYRTLLVLWLTLSGVLAGAQSFDDPRHPVYKDLELWQNQGLIAPLPFLKPYPLALIRSRLQFVAESGTGRAAQRAAAYLTRIAPEFKAGVTVFTDHRFLISSDHRYLPNDYWGTSGAYLTTDSFFWPFLSLSGYAGAVAADRGTLSALPQGRFNPYDYILDDSAVKVLERSYLLALSMGGTVALGDDQTWFQAGLNRREFGPQDNGILLSPESPEAAAFSFTTGLPGFWYTKYFYALSASKDTVTGPLTNHSDVYPDKYLAGQSFEFSFWDGALQLGLFEHVVFGERLEPVYLLPVVSSLYSSIYTGMKDNILVGGLLRGRLPYGLHLTGLFHADDLSFLNLFRLKFDGKTKLAALAGLGWTSEWPLVQSVDMDYSLVTPYTFAHFREFNRGEEPDAYFVNYVNFTHQRQGLVDLDPNSDRLRLRVTSRPMAEFELGLDAQLRRHANATTELYGPGAFPFLGTADGGFMDNGYEGHGNTHKFDTPRFLQQAVIEQLLQIGLTWNFQFGDSSLLTRVFGGYTFEYGWNRRARVAGSAQETAENPDPTGEDRSWYNGPVPIEGNNGVRHYINMGLKVSF